MLTVATHTRTVLTPVSSPTSSRLRLFSGSANVRLSEQVAEYLSLDLGPVTRKRFADGEIYIQFQESIRGCDVFLLQPTCDPVNDRLMELMIMIDACKRASARQITAVLPYYGYARADRRTSGRESITAKLASDLIVQAGADRVLSVDLHTAQVQAYFDIPIDHISSFPVIIQHLWQRNLPNPVVVSPDIGGVARARSFAKAFGGAPLAIIDKRHSVSASPAINVIGQVKDKTAIIIDDIIDTGSTLLTAAQAVQQAGAKHVVACATHGVLSPPAWSRLQDPVFDEVIITDTIPVPPEKRGDRLTVLSVAGLLGETIRCIHHGASVSDLLMS